MKGTDPAVRPAEQPSTYWRRQTFAAYVFRATTITIVIWLPSIGLSIIAAGDGVPNLLDIVATLGVLLSIMIEVFVLYFYASKIMRLNPPAYDPQLITAMSVGAVSSITTFMGTAAALVATVLVALPQPLNNPSFSTLISFEMPALWLFIMLTVRFREACYFYQVWELRRRHGL